VKTRIDSSPSGEAMTPHRLLLVSAVAVALTGCNQTSSSGPGPAMAAGATSVSLPAGAACTPRLERFRAVIENENRVGQVNPSVYRQVDAELTGAERACAAGRDAEARSLLAATKARHGYPG
jgi:hypothetical protein